MQDFDCIKKKQFVLRDSSRVPINDRLLRR